MEGSTLDARVELSRCRIEGFHIPRARSRSFGSPDWMHSLTRLGDVFLVVAQPVREASQANCGKCRISWRCSKLPNQKKSGIA